MTEEERLASDALARLVVRHGLTAPAVMFLESLRPVGRLAAVGLTFLNPLADAVWSGAHLTGFRDLLERRGGIDDLIARIERQDAEARGALDQGKRES